MGYGNYALYNYPRCYLLTVGLRSCRWQYRSIFIRLSVVASQICEITRENSNLLQFKVIQGHWSWCQSKVLQVLDSKFKRISYCFRDIDRRIKLENIFFPHPSLVWRPTRGNPLEFLDETYPAITRGIALLYGENCIQPFWMIHSCDVTERQTDGW